MFFFFFYSETYIERMKGEAPNDKNDRGQHTINEWKREKKLKDYIFIAIRVAAKWYGDHLKAVEGKNDIDVVLLTDDRDNREKAKESGINSISGN